MTCSRCQAELTADSADEGPNLGIGFQREAGRTIKFLSSTSSPDGDPLSPVEWDFGDGHTGSGGTVEHTYAADGQFHVIATVDEPIKSKTAELDLDIQSNRSPVAGDDEVTGAAGTTIPITPLVNDSDPDGDGFSLLGTSNATGGAVTCANNFCTFQAGFRAGDFGFDYTISDGRGGTDTGHVAVTLTPPPNVPPVVVDEHVTVTSGGSLEVDVATNDHDADGDALWSRAKKSATASPRNVRATGSARSKLGMSWARRSSVTW